MARLWYHRRVGRYVVVALAALVPFAAACQPDEYAVLISARSESAVETLNLTVIRMDRDGRPFPAGPFPVDRPLEDIRDNEPIRVAVRLDGPTEVMVHLQGRAPDGSRLVASRCYRVRGVIEDRVLLVRVTDALDGDGDGWLDDPSAGCFEPGAGGPVACPPAYQCAADEDRDCDGADPEVHPGAQEKCNDGIDQDCDGEDAPCSDDDADGWRKCSGLEDFFGGTCDCQDDFDTIYPGAEEICGDGIDQDCDGADLPCDNDGDGYREGRDCDDGDPSIHPGATEMCTAPGDAPADEDCDGLVDELIDCAPGDLDKDGVIGCGHPEAPASCDCNDCDSGIKPGAIDACEDGVDANCDGMDPTCPVGDGDRDGVAGMAGGGADCNDTNPRIFPGAPERCGDGVSQSCAGDVDCSGDLDGDGYPEPEQCEGNAEVTYWSDEACNGIDDDCDMIADEVMSAPDAVGTTPLPQGRTGCIGPNPTVPGCTGDACVVDYTTNIFHCGGCRLVCNPGPRVIADVCADAVCDCANEPGIAACSEGWQCCGSGCEDVMGDILHCGDCNADCNDGRPGYHPRADQCAGGSCQCGTSGPCTDTPFAICCGGSCTDPLTDRNNCGACGNVCGPSSSCVGGRCVCDASYLADCDGDISGNGCETDTRTDLAHCGGCGRNCTRAHATASCTGGTCRINTCNSGWKDCNGVDSDGCETPLDTLSDCGDCDVSCSLAHAGESCSTMSCRITTCDPLWGDCSGGDANGCETPVNTLTNCGGCGVACSLAHATPTCTTGACRIESCDSLWGDCVGGHADGCETQLTSTTNCGGCGVACTRANATATCAGGSCAIDSCNGGYRDCNGTDSDGCEIALGTTSNCLDCGDGCSAPAHATPSCMGSGCAWSCDGGYHDCSGSCVSNTDPATCGTRCSPCTDPANGSPTCDGTSCGIACDGGYHDCSGSCVSNTSTATCGTSCSPCPDPANGSPTCDGTSCGIACDGGYHACSGSCVSDTSTATCGTRCSPCPEPAHSSATCDGTDCGFTCDSGFEDCNGMASDGCEADLTLDGDCGGCGVSCSGMDVCCPNGSGVYGCRAMGSCA